MDYTKSGNPISAGKQPKHKVGKKGLGAEKSPTGGRATKEEILAKMKAVAEAKKDGQA
jgi:hypothetical protein